MYLCVRDINFSFNTIFRLDFESVPTVWYILFFALFIVIRKHVVDYQHFLPKKAYKWLKSTNLVYIAIRQKLLYMINETDSKIKSKSHFQHNLICHFSDNCFWLDTNKGVGVDRKMGVQVFKGTCKCNPEGKGLCKWTWKWEE
jgi:hypothetical protein